MRLIENEKLNKDETYIIGDSANEIRAGKANEIKTIAVTWGFGERTKLELEKPDYIVNSIKELKDLLETK